MRALGAFVKLIYKLATFLFEFRSAFLGDVLCGNTVGILNKTRVFSVFSQQSVFGETGQAGDARCR